MSFDNAPFVPRFVVGFAMAVGFIILAGAVLAVQNLTGCGEATRLPNLEPPKLPRPVCFVNGESVVVEHGPFAGHHGVIVNHGTNSTEPEYWIQSRNADGRLVTIQVHQSDLAGGDTDHAKRSLRRY